MELHHRHPWRVDTATARAIQNKLRHHVVTLDRCGPIELVAGVDVGFEHDNSIARAAVAVLSFPDLEPVTEAIARRRVTFPYVPGFLSFREVPAVLGALRKLKRLPDVILCDGQGCAHPRRFGIACHLGVLLDIPTIGVGKTRLIGKHREPGPEKGDWAELYHQDEVIGAVLRSRAGTKPIFVSVGHRVGLSRAIDLVLRCCPRYRLPETTRAAHRLASH